MKTLEKDFKGTPGEFHYVDNVDIFTIETSYNGITRDILVPYSLPDVPEAEANAKLFCASKRMVEVLEMAYEAIDHTVNKICDIEGLTSAEREVLISQNTVLKAIENVLDQAL